MSRMFRKLNITYFIFPRQDNTVMPVAWERLIRFVATDGRVLRGEPILPSEGFDIGYTEESTGLQAKVIEGTDILDETGVTKVTDEVVTVQRLLGPLVATEIDTIRCVGLNYAKHSKSSYLAFLNFILNRNGWFTELHSSRDR